MIDIEGGSLINFSTSRYHFPRGFQNLHSFLCYFEQLFVPLSLRTCFICKFVQSTGQLFLQKYHIYYLKRNWVLRDECLKGDVYAVSNKQVRKIHFSKIPYCQNSLTDLSVISKGIISRVCILNITVSIPYGYKIINVGNNQTHRT